MKTYLALLAFAVALVGCGEAFDPQVAQTPAQAQAHQPAGQAAAPQQQAQAAEAGGGFSWGSMLTGAAAGYMLSRMLEPSPPPAQQSSPVYSERPRPAYVARPAPAAPPKPAVAPAPAVKRATPTAPPAPPKFSSPSLPKPYTVPVKPSAPSKFSGPSGYSSARTTFSSSPSRRR